MPNSDSAQALYTALAHVPEGQVVTYGQLARLAGRPGAARWAGRLLRELPTDSTLPWHRVVNAAGRISLPLDSGGQRQLDRLAAEGIHRQGASLLRHCQYRG
ncbi:MGMT family protein [Gilvimarinus sp. DA14]|uniref:MGMT family protein n=1 Tax=Gilvimarinus sp. DA14 TaxID=2956798 RepID=UPI0020B7FE9B|nr:MGMT family protein [Gilvimarinus sp. DA14]UTF60029.1 MGMT family protein [Gilvimarinus sp. DA14]